ARSAPEPPAPPAMSESVESLAPALAVVVFPAQPEVPTAAPAVVPPPAAGRAEPPEPFGGRPLLAWAALAYLVVALALLARGLVGYVGLARLPATAAPAPRHA